MYKEITNVYVPVKTPDHKTWALLLALLIHSGILGFILYTNHTKSLDDAVMETTLVTPDQLSAIEGQIAANQDNHAKNAGDTQQLNAAFPTIEMLAGGKMSNIPAPNPTPSNSSNLAPTDPQMQQINQTLAQQQADYEQKRDAVADQLDHEANQSLQGVAQNAAQQQLNQIQQVKDFKDTESHADADANELKQATQIAAKRLAEQQASITATKTANNKSFALPSNGATDNETGSHAGGGQTVGGNGAAHQGGASSGSAAGYKQTIQRIIMENWNPPANAPKGTPQRAHFSISPTGSISNVSVDGADSPLKTSLEQAIRNASLPTPPTDAYERFANNNITFNVQ